MQPELIILHCTFTATLVALKMQFGTAELWETTGNILMLAGMHSNNVLCIIINCKYSWFIINMFNGYICGSKLIVRLTIWGLNQSHRKIFDLNITVANQVSHVTQTRVEPNAVSPRERQ